MLPRYRIGGWVDEWGCRFENPVDGMDGIVKGHPIRDEKDIYSLKIPSDRSGDCMPHGFMYLRLLDLCGFENAMLLFGACQKDKRDRIPR